MAGFVENMTIFSACWGLIILIQALCGVWGQQCSMDALRNALPPLGGQRCGNITLVGMPSTKISLVAQVLREAVEVDQSRLMRTVTVLSRRMASQQPPQGGDCTVVLYRDFKDSLCAAARHHGGCPGCSAVAMEAKMKSWMHRLFSDSNHESWTTWLPELESSGARLVRYECWVHCHSLELESAFRTWLGAPLDLRAPGRSSSSSSIAGDTFSLSLNDDHHHIGDWKSCFTEKTLTAVQHELGYLMKTYGYSPSSGLATCARHTTPTFDDSASVSIKIVSSVDREGRGARGVQGDDGPVGRLARFRQRISSGLLVTGVDKRFSKKILGNNAILRCTKEGCLPDFITIGAQKGGTTSLYHYLKGYMASIETSKREELNFFTERYQNGIGWLRKEFSKDPSKLRGYKSPNYLPHPLAPFRIQAMLPNIKLVLLLREPVSR